MDASIMRRALWLLTILLAVPQARADGDEYAFRVLLGEREIGAHTFSIRSEAGRRVVDSRADFDVRFAFVPVYSYEHRNREVWEDGCLRTMESRTDDNGREFRVRVENTAEGLRVASGDEVRQLEGCVKSFAYWDPSFLDEERLLNAQDGRYLEVDVRDEGTVALDLGERRVRVRQYRLVSAEGLDICVWYDADSGRWVALQSRRDGRLIRYVPREAENLAVVAAAD